MKTNLKIALGLLLTHLALGVYAQEGTWSNQTSWIEPHEEYGKYVEAARRTAPLSSDLFGESVSLYNGATEFSVVDVSLPGNDQLPVEFRRRYKIENRDGSKYLAGLGNWDIDVPHVYGTFGAAGWILPGPTNQRCSNTVAPAHSSVYFTLEEMWSGNYMHIPGQGDSEILLNTQAKVPAVQDGNTYPWITEGKWRIRCTNIVNGFGGQGFIAVSPEGVKYTFNHGYEENGQPMGKGMGPGFIDQRKHVWILATRIEDRFGNFVTLSYSGKKLTGVTSSDGRSITITYSGDRVSSVTAAGRTWTYTYGTVSGAHPVAPLLTVTRPDATKWQYNYVTGSYLAMIYFSPSIEAEQPDCPPSNMEPGGSVLEVTHPSGAVGRFEFNAERHYRAGTPHYCIVRAPGDQYQTFPEYFDSFSLVKKTITGAGLQPMVWTYDYQGFPQDFTYAPGYCPGCDTRKKVTVVQPDGSKQVNEFGISYGFNEGLLLATEVQSPQGAVVSRTETTYLPLAEVGTLAFAERWGSSLRSWDPTNNLIRPIVETKLTQQGVSFETLNETFDALANPLQVRRRSMRLSDSPATVRDSRTESFEYEHNYSLWVIDKVKTVSLVAPQTMQLARVEFDALARPTRLFGIVEQGATGTNLQQEVTYHANGRPHLVKDGKGNTTTLTDWYRGIPRHIAYADATTQSATVNASGWITAITDPNGFTTGYGYDNGGRINLVTPPGGDTVAWNPTTITFAKSTVVKFGFPVGTWQETIATGNGRKVTWYDAFWRPRLVQEYDTANETGTQRLNATVYDVMGRVEFAAYPRASATSMASFTQGVWTEYDTLGRPVSVSQDSEQGLLTTLTEYLDDFQVRVTNPLLHATTTQFQVFDRPDTSSPVLIAEPAGRTTRITRDALGRTTMLARTDSTWATTVERRYAFDVYGRLCKQLEPETGATVLQYDDAGNLAWSATGLSAPVTPVSDCEADRTAAHASGRRVDRTYDTRNRLLTLSFPDGNGNQTWAYTLDGLPATITAANGTATVVNTYTYNKLRLLTGESSGTAGWYTWAMGYGYTANGHLSSQVYPSGQTVTYAPNALGQATQVGSYATGVSYHPNGAIKQFTYGNGIVHTMELNARQLPASSLDSGGVLHHVHQYDKNGNVTATLDQLNAARSRTMTYDPLDRLLTAQAAIFGGDGVHRFTYDTLDNMRSWQLTGVKDYAQYTYDDNQRLASIQNTSGATLHEMTYDVQGNLHTKDATTYHFDYGNRLRAVVSPSVTETYRYDGHGRRVLAWTTEGSKQSMYANNGQLVYQQLWPAAMNKAVDYYYLSGSLVATRSVPLGGGSATVAYQHTDGLGSPVATTDALGAVVERTNFDPYGNPINRTVEGVGFTGHVMDARTGLVYMQQRYYDAGLGAFLSSDPMSADTRIGWNFNRYNYGASNPYKYTDPDGRAICADAACATSFIESQPGRPAGFSPALNGNEGLPGGLEGDMLRAANAPGPIITFENDDPNAPSPNLPVSTATAVMVEEIVVSSGVASVNINSTTGGNHSPTSRHASGRAVDINRVNGDRVDSPSAAPGVAAIQRAARANPNTRENYGPSTLEKTTSPGGAPNTIVNPALQRQHRNHIHLSGQK